MYLFIDTETTGVTPGDRIVSIRCMFFDSKGRETSSMYTLVKPEGFSIPAEATAIHGITTAKALRDGYSLVSVLDSITAEIARLSPNNLIGHNVSFDLGMVIREYSCARKPESLSQMDTFCTMKETTQICRLPGKYGDYKWPKLDELHRHLFGEGLKDAHDARADVEACARCFFELQRLGFT
jgi:DNA polymerase-3 subunit epsilon